MTRYIILIASDSYWDSHCEIENCMRGAQNAQGLPDREVCVYSVSCRSQNNIDITLDWLTKHAKS